MRDYSVVDDYGRSTRFNGVMLVDETTDTAAGELAIDEVRRLLQGGNQVLQRAGVKPQWLEVTVWRTEGGSFVVRRTNHYRRRHLTDRCSKAEGYELRDATYLDIYPCPNCNPMGDLERGWGQASRISVEAHHTPGNLIVSLQDDRGRYNNLSRAILSDLSEQDDDVDAAWNTVYVP